MNDNEMRDALNRAKVTMTGSPALIAAVRAYARRNYERDGWDVLVECYSDDDILEIIGKARTFEGAIAKLRRELKGYADYRADIAGSAW